MTQRLDYRALSPDGVKGLFASQPHLIKALPRPFLDIIWIRVSQINGCAYCVDQHVKDALQHGASERKLHHVAIWWESPLFDEKEQAALAYAEAVTRLEHQRVADDVYQAAGALFDERMLTDLTIAIVAMNAWNRLAIAMRKGAPA
jgi:AhpD family alkylhydroperoxidase